ncbi:thiopurine S-methyltransferase [Algoriphagus boseongensis]|uniref:Thiopurine S-methyltransferase n=1 Tax=Algoriphagus boseongensis TaxID=1442587 RepID=A0A4R6T1Q0_9BACT|nr:SAM-dependent methyltransferase [Algoriphagus boseongensis]TDQ13550.1 thiopurine S-methyltransferase [Algoriphagus boseongensis]
MVDLDENFWTSRYEQGYTGWDIGSVSTPIYQYLCQIENKNIKLLVPGAGNAHEIKAAWELGFRNVFLLDISEIPINNFLEKNPDFPESQTFHQDFFSHNGRYDLILEQTFFCALDPNLRNKYASKMHELLNPEGKLVGVLFNRIFQNPGPPFGGSEKEYRTYFDPFFKYNTYEECKNSIPARAGSEWWINLQKSTR